MSEEEIGEFLVQLVIEDCADTCNEDEECNE